jgi:dimethylargininase
MFVMLTSHPTHALVRPPGANFTQALCSQPVAIDVRLAQAQHAEYRQALAAAGLAVETLPVDERYPDGCFIQDTAVITAGAAVICRSAAASRLGEAELTAAWLAGRLRLTPIVPPGTLEGGDVMVLPDRVLVGRSARTNRAGIAQLAAALAASSQARAVQEVSTGDYLHLLTAATYLGRGVLLAVGDYAGQPAFAGLEVIVAPPDEAYAANALAVGPYVILPAGYPRIAAALAARGFTPLPVPLTEFAKADGGATCLAVVW